MKPLRRSNIMDEAYEMPIRTRAMAVVFLILTPVIIPVCWLKDRHPTVDEIREWWPIVFKLAFCKWPPK